MVIVRRLFCGVSRVSARARQSIFVQTGVRLEAFHLRFASSTLCEPSLSTFVLLLDTDHDEEHQSLYLEPALTEHDTQLIDEP